MKGPWPEVQVRCYGSVAASATEKAEATEACTRSTNGKKMEKTMEKTEVPAAPLWKVRKVQRECRKSHKCVESQEKDYKKNNQTKRNPSSQDQLHVALCGSSLKAVDLWIFHVFSRCVGLVTSRQHWPRS